MSAATHDAEILKVLAEQPSLDILRTILIRGPLRQRDFVAMLGLSAVTVSRALNSLERSGIVCTDGRRAPYSVVFEDKTEALVQAAADLSEFILTDQAASAKERAKDLRRRRMERSTQDAAQDGTA